MTLRILSCVLGAVLVAVGLHLLAGLWLAAVWLGAVLIVAGLFTDDGGTES